MPLVEKRYAEALVDMVLEGGVIDAYQEELLYLDTLFDQQGEIKTFLLNPEISVDIKKDLVKKVFEGKIRGEIIGFLLLLLDKGRFRNLTGIVKEFVILSDKMKNTINMTIVSSAPLTNSQLDKIRDKYMKLYNVSYAKVSTEVDTGLMGGVKIIVGDKVIDGSIKGRLEDLKQVLTSS